MEEPALSIQVLKLILQPLVENALYHGIKPKGEKGHITVAAKVEKDFLILSVADDGVGMSPERLGKITTPPSKAQNNSFGLWGTIERLRIFYGVEDILRIETAVGKGTIITIHIPLKG
ncbi:MAG TPA: hypothetical protein DDW50_13835 [Firmicutes bacterium]|nr:hypothetical protein [Bacillota bacterium]